MKNKNFLEISKNNLGNYVVPKRYINFNFFKNNKLKNYGKSLRLKKILEDIFLNNKMGFSINSKLCIPKIKLIKFIDDEIFIVIHNLASIDIENFRKIIDSELVGEFSDYLLDFCSLSENSKYVYIVLKNSKKMINFKPKSISDFCSFPYALRLDCLNYWNFVDNPHAFIFGKTGSGKSTLIYFLLTQVLKLGCKFYIYDIKQEFKSINFLSDLILTDKSEILKNLELICEEIRKRNKILTDANIKIINQKLQATDLNFKPIFIFVDEFLALSENLSKEEVVIYKKCLKEISILGRSTLVNLVLSSQSAKLNDVFSSDLRNQLSLKISLGQTTRDNNFMIFNDRDLPTNFGKFKGLCQLSSYRFCVDEKGKPNYVISDLPFRYCVPVPDIFNFRLESNLKIASESEKGFFNENC